MGLCHAILAFFKITKISCLQLNDSKNNGPGLSFKTILWHIFCFLLFVATDGKDKNGWN